MTSKPFHNIFCVSQSPLVDLMSFNSFFVGTYFKGLTTVFFTKTLKVFKRDNTIASQITKKHTEAYTRCENWHMYFHLLPKTHTK